MPNAKRASRSIWALLLLPLLALTACESMGPGTVTRDRFDYAGAVGKSWKSQMLLNLVKIRYGDIPVFMDVGQVVAGYSMQRTLSGTASINTFNQGAPFQAITGAARPDGQRHLQRQPDHHLHAAAG